MNADIHNLYRSDRYHVLDFRCHCTDRTISKSEYSKNFKISFVRKGNFLYNVFRHSFDAYNGKWIVTKPGYEHTVGHIHEIPDECTIFEFEKEFYHELNGIYHLDRHWFFGNADRHSLVINASVETEYLHYTLLSYLKRPGRSRILIDMLVMELVQSILSLLDESQDNHKVDDRLKKNHLATIERAKEYIAHNFIEDISLSDISQYCYVSPFHFSRLFKTFTSYSPYQYLLKTRLKNSEFLLRNTDRAVTEICFSSGFNSLEHFITAFKQTYQAPPSHFRNSISPK